MIMLRTWAGDPDEHVRRLVSEGTRPRLPWATRLPQFQRDPGPVLELLDLLKDDPSEYVRRSVANNLNDISKDNPQVALDVAGRWYEGRERLFKHALRTLLKAGDPQALAILGYSTRAVSAHAQLPPRIAIGSSLPLEVTLTGQGRVLVDIVVHFVKANGSTSQKVFRGAELDVDGQATLRRSISFRQHSTRRHYPGEHRIEVLINGRRHELGVIDVVATAAG
jgi:3-methyladenine DNA glycosylase AlkC